MCQDKVGMMGLNALLRFPGKDQHGAHRASGALTQF